MAVDMFMKIDGIKGESTDDKHKDESMFCRGAGACRSRAQAHLGGGAGSGKVNVHDCRSRVHRRGIAGPLPVLLQRQASEGRQAGRAQGGREPLEYLILTMEDVIVSSVSNGGSGGRIA